MSNRELGQPVRRVKLMISSFYSSLLLATARYCFRYHWLLQDGQTGRAQEDSARGTTETFLLFVLVAPRGLVDFLTWRSSPKAAGHAAECCQTSVRGCGCRARQPSARARRARIVMTVCYTQPVHLPHHAAQPKVAQLSSCRRMTIKGI